MKTYIVGGAVRDMLMGFEPKDVDYVVVGSTHQEMVDAGFRKVGADFPVYLHPQTNDEYALARMERKTGEGYLGFEVQTNGVTLEEDLSRRDLTINAMAMAVDTDEIVDPFNGQADLKNKCLRHVSAAFAEDPLRVVRLARFYARYTEFKVAPKTKYLAACITERGDLNHLPNERFWAELHKVFQETRPDRFFEMLHELTADEFCNFFKNLYGGPLSDSELDRVQTVAFNTRTLVREEARVMVHTAVVATGDSTLLTADSRTQTLYKNLTKLRSYDVNTPENMFELLKQCKAWSVGPGLDDLMEAMHVANVSGEGFVFTATEVYNAAQASKRVESSQFPDVKGKALGEAIERDRIGVIAETLLS